MLIKQQADLNNFKIKNLIGEGSFGKVFLVEEKSTHILYAAKISTKMCEGPIEQIQFMNEVSIFSKLNYPTVLHFYCFNCKNFDSEPYPTVITDYIPNKSLQDMFILEHFSQTAIDWTSTSKYIILLGIALSLNYLFTQNIVHRDVKPTNILLNEKFYPIMCDFGLSKMTTKKLTDFLMKSTIGSLFYMAPEISKGKEYTYKIDVYSFSLIALQLINNLFMIPFEFDTSQIFGIENQKFLNRCHSQNPLERPSFYEICSYVVKKEFIDAFNSVNIDDVIQFFEFVNHDNDGNEPNPNNDANNSAIADSLYFFGLFLFENGNDMNYALENFKKAADAGNVDAMFRYAQVLDKGDSGIQVDKKTALEYYNKAAEKGHAEANLNIARMLHEGDGVEQNETISLHYLNMAAVGENQQAISILNKKIRSYNLSKREKEINQINDEIEIQPINNVKESKPNNNAKSANPINAANESKPINDSKEHNPINETKKSKAINNEKELKPINDVKEPNPIKAAKESKPNNDSKEPNPINEVKESKPNNDSKEPNPIKAAKEPNPINEVKEPNPNNTAKESKPINDSKEPNPINETKESKAINNEKELKPTNDAKESKAINNVKEPNSIKAAKELNLINEVKEPNPNNTAKEPNPINEVKEPNPINEVKEPNPINEVKEPNPINEVKEPNPNNTAKEPNLINEVKEPNPNNTAKESKPINDSKEPNPIKAAKEPNLINDAKESKQIHDSKEPNPINETKESKAINNEKEPNPINEAKESKPIHDSKEPNPINETKESKAINNEKELKPTNDAKESKAINNEKELKPTNDAKESKAINNVKEPNPIKATKEPNPINEAKESKLIHDAKESKPIHDSKEPNPINETKESKAINNEKESKPTNDVKEPNPIKTAKESKTINNEKESKPINVAIKSKPINLSNEKHPRFNIKNKDSQYLPIKTKTSLSSSLLRATQNSKTKNLDKKSKICLYDIDSNSKIENPKQISKIMKSTKENSIMPLSPRKSNRININRNELSLSTQITSKRLGQTIKDKNGIVYTLYENDLTAEISNSSNVKGDIFIQSYIDYQLKQYKITKVGDNSFANSMIESLSFAESSFLKCIGKLSFKNSKLSILYIPANLSELDYTALQEADCLKNIEVDPSNQIITKKNNVVFYQNQHIIFVQRLNENQEIDFSEFNIEEGITRIGRYAFSHVNYIRSINSSFPSLKNLGSYSFYKFESLERIVIKTEKLQVGYYCFAECKNLNFIEIDCKFLTIGNNCFENCTNLSTISFKNIQNVQFFSKVFNGCQNLKNFAIKNASSIQLKNDSFGDMNQIDSIMLMADSLPYSTSFINCSSLTNISLKTNSKISINSSTFQYCFLLNNVMISSSSEIVISENAFANMRNLKSVNFECNSIAFQNISFYICSSLNYFNLKSQRNVIIAENTFVQCSSLAIFSVYSLSDLIVSEKFEKCSLEKVHLIGKQIKISDGCFSKCPKLTDFLITRSVSVSFGRDQFLNCIGLKKIVIEIENESKEEKIVEFGLNCFSNTDNLKEINLTGTEVKIVNHTSDGDKLANINLANNENIISTLK